MHSESKFARYEVSTFHSNVTMQQMWYWTTQTHSWV